MVDDNETNLHIVEHWLQEFGAEVVLAETPAAALSRLAEAASNHRPIQAAILDFGMPVMNGMQLAREILLNPAYRKMPLVLLTSYVDKSYRTEALEIGFAAYLPKPTRKRKLFECLISVLGHAPEPEDMALQPAGREALGLKVLVAEDNPVNQMVARRFLESWGAPMSWRRTAGRCWMPGREVHTIWC